MMTALQIKQLDTAPYGEQLLQGIELELAEGELLGLIGPNGSGKSSLLHTIAGGLPIDGGSIVIHQRPLQQWGHEERARALSMQSQHASLNFPFSVEEVILLGRIPHASGAAQDTKILEEVLLATDTAGLRHRPYTQLSGGEKQRVQLARAVAQVWRSEDAPGRLLLLDEPSSALDMAHQRMVLDLITTLRSEGCAVILSSHDFNLLSGHADKFLVLQDGKQYSFGSPAEVLTTNMFTEVFSVDVLIQDHPGNNAPLVIQL